MTDMSGKVVAVTGATSGIGRVTAEHLVQRGARVIIIARNAAKARRTVEEIGSRLPGGAGADRLNVLQGDLSLMSDVRSIASRIFAEEPRLDVLINNAGLFSAIHQTTSEGNEMTWAVNYLAPFLLTTLLLPLMRRTGRPDSHARIVNVASGSHMGMELDFGDLQSSRGYNAYRAYGRSKLAIVMFSYELARRLHEEGANVDVNALHPGFVATGIGRSGFSLLDFFARGVFVLMRPFQISAEKGARTSLLVATDPSVEGVSGEYFSRERSTPSSAESRRSELWSRLWERTERQLQPSERPADSRATG